MVENTQPHPLVQNQQQPSAGQQTSNSDGLQDAQQTAPDPSITESTDEHSRLYDIFRPSAQNIKIILQMLVGVILTVLVILKIINYVGHPIPIILLTTQTLGIVGVALIFSTVFELAYTLFTPGPDEAVDPLITGLAAVILLVISNITQITFDIAGGVALLVLALVVLFILKYFFIEEKGWKRLLNGDPAKKKRSSEVPRSGKLRGILHNLMYWVKKRFSVATRSSKAQPQQSSKDIGTNDTASPSLH